MDLCWLKNNEICNLYKEMDLTRKLRQRRLQWVSHMLRMQDERTPKKALNGWKAQKKMDRRI